MDFEEEDDLEIQDVPQFIDPDNEFENECCFWLMKALRGRNTGRQLKRRIFKYGVINFLAGFPMLVITITQLNKFGGLSYYVSKDQGMSLTELQYWECILALLISFLLAIALKYWASLVTNRDLLQKLLTMLLFYGTFQFIMTLWCLCTLFLVFKSVDWANEYHPPFIQTCYILSIIFLLPHTISIVYYMLEISYLSGEIDLRADISEPDTPEDTINLENVMLVDICGAVIAFPCLMCIQCTKICDCCAEKLSQRDYEVTEESPAGSAPRPPKVKSADGTGLSLGALSIALTSLISQPGRRTRGSVVPSDGPDEEDLEDQNDMKRLQALRMKKRNAVPETEPPIHPPPSSSSKRPLTQSEHQDNEKEDDPDPEDGAADPSPGRSPLSIDPSSPMREQQGREQQQQQGEDGLNQSAHSHDELDRSSSPSKKIRTTLLAKDFKVLWSQLPVAGSFQCKLRMAPNIQKLTEHLRKQGFHVVYASSSSDTETEVSICNVKESAEDTARWFMTRFVFTNTLFSAVMKSEDNSLVEAYVKRFTLARVLKIDTS